MYVIISFQIQLNPSTKDKLLEVLQKNFIDDSLNSTSKISNAWNLVFLMVRQHFRLLRMCVHICILRAHTIEVRIFNGTLTIL